MERSRIPLENALLAGDKDDNTCDNLNKPVIEQNTDDKAQQQRQRIFTFLETIDSITSKQVGTLLGVNEAAPMTSFLRWFVSLSWWRRV
nr:hypothetical protein [uncultured Sphaerochaeta sp.]